MRRWLPVSFVLAAVGCNQAQPIDVVIEPPAKEAAADPMNLPFHEACITDRIPDGQEAPPDATVSGKATALLRLEVEKKWPAVKLDGKPRVELKTDAGDIVIELAPAKAPNHARNFLALAAVGYFDGLGFDRVIHQVSDDEGKTRLDMVKFGCPAGTGERGVGHLGYFLRPELAEDVKHAEGTVGFWHDDEPDTAGCRLYITLGPAPALDGNFTIVGKVVTGMDVVRKIAEAPVVDPNSYPEKETPRKPVLIRKAAALHNQ